MGRGVPFTHLGAYWRGVVAEAAIGYGPLFGMLGVFDMIGAIFLILLLRGGITASRLSGI
jgi:hypothetical protein